MFAKIFASLWEGSMVGQPDVQLVWIFLLANADAEGTVERSKSNIAALTGIPVERVSAALKVLESEDMDSRSEKHGGRRIVRLYETRDWGWMVVNYKHYRNMRNEETRREQNREASRRRRAMLTERLTDADGQQNQPRTEDRRQIEAEPKGGFPSASLQENAASRAVECEAESAGADTAGETACSDAGTRAGSKEAPVGPVAIGSLVRGIAARLEMPDRATRTAAARPATNGCEDASAPKSDTKRAPERNTEAAEYVTPVYEIAKPHGGAAVSETLSLCGRLHNCGIRHTGVLKGIARHWLDNRGRIRNRWAYYSPGSDGFDKLRQIIAAESAVEEHRIAEAATREWLESVRAP